MLTNRNASSSPAAAAEATGRSLSYQGQPNLSYQGQPSLSYQGQPSLSYQGQQSSLGYQGQQQQQQMSQQQQQQQQQQRQMCLPLSPASSTSLSSTSEDGRKIRQITKQNSFNEDQTHSYNVGPHQQQLVVDRRLSHAMQPTTVYQQLDRQNRTKMAATPSSRLSAGGGRVGAGVGGSTSSMSTSWTGEGHGGSGDVPSAWRQFRNSDRPLKCGGAGGGQQQRLSSAKFASSIELSLDDDGVAKGGGEPPHPTSTLIASPTTMGGAGRVGGGGGGGVGRVDLGSEAGRYFYQSPSPSGTQTDLGGMFESPSRAPPYHPFRSGEGQKTLTQNGAHVLPPGLLLETSTAGSYPELHNIALHESRRGSLPAPRKLDETSSTVPLVVWTRREGPYENSPNSLTANHRHRNEANLYRSNGDGNHLQNGNGKAPTTFLHDGSSFKGSSDGISLLNACEGKRFWSARNGSTTAAVSGQSRYVDGTTRENIYEEIDGSSSLRSTTTSGNSAKQPPVPQPPPTTTTTDVVQSGGYRGPIMSLRLTPADQLTLLQQQHNSISSSPLLSNRHRLFSSTRSIHQSIDDVFSSPQDYPTNPRNRTTQGPSGRPTGSAAHPNSESRCHPARPYSRNPSDNTDVGTARVPDRVTPRGVQAPLGVTTDGYLEPVTLTQPLDVTVARLEALLQEKDGERKRLQAAMEDKECCLIKQLRLEKRNSELRLVELGDEWNRRLACHQQKAFRIEQSLLSQIYKLRTEKKTIREQLDRLRVENETLTSRVSHLENDLQTSRTNESRLQTLNDEAVKEVELLRVQLMDATVALLSSATTNGDLNNEQTLHFVCPSADDQTDEYGRIQPANDEVEEREEEEEDGRLPKNNNNEKNGEEEVDDLTAEERDATYRRNTTSGSIDDDVIRRLERELEETRDRLADAEERMRTDQEQWMDEKKKVIAYQKQLQLNYVQIVQRNKMLQQETHQLALELERQHIRQVDAVDSPPSTAPLANGGETTPCGVELTREARPSTLTRST